MTPVINDQLFLTYHFKATETSIFYFSLNGITLIFGICNKFIFKLNIS